MKFDFAVLGVDKFQFVQDVIRAVHFNTSRTKADETPIFRTNGPKLNEACSESLSPSNTRPTIWPFHSRLLNRNCPGEVYIHQRVDGPIG